MRTGLWMGTMFAVAKVTQYTTGRFGMAWGAAELIQVGILAIGFFLIIRRMQKLEGEVSYLRDEVAALRLRLDAIKAVVTKGLRTAAEKVLESVA